MTGRVVVVLPSLDPDYRLNLVVDGCIEKGFKNIILVDDGSDENHKAPFIEAAKKPGVTVLTHEVNKGKGSALKTAFAYVAENFKDSTGVVTVDGDNQHHKDDILKCAEAMEKRGDVVLGCRDFSEPHVPWKSRTGNNITKTVFRLLCGVKVSDTQTGLRAIPYCYLAKMLKITGERFEFETNMLLEMKTQNIPMSEVTIQTIYEDKENSTTHFHPFRDSFRIYKVILKYLFSSGTSTIADLGLFFLLNILFSNVIDSGFTVFGKNFSKDWIIVTLATFGARLCSSVYNYKLNRHLVFKGGTNWSVVKYYVLVIVQMCVSAASVSVLSVLFSAGSVLRTVCKAVVDTILFLVNFRVQKCWVFKSK